MHRSSLTAAAAGVREPLIACATNPATGKKQLMLVSEAQEIAMGKAADQEAVAAYGLYPDPKVQAYVDRLGKGLAAQSERPDLPWSFKVVDDPTVNAFALPGGYIYVTRGIMAHLRSEAELVAVLGHEIGHVTGRHSASQMSKQQLAMGGLIVGMAVEPELQRFGGLAQQGLGLLFLKFGRDDENQADELGLRYMARQDYDPREMLEVFGVLDGVTRAEGGGARMPDWLSTHPSPGNRTTRIQGQIAATGASGSIVNRREYLRQLDGMVFGENPTGGLLPGERLLPPRPPLPARLPARLQDAEPEAGGGGGERGAGRDHRPHPRRGGVAGRGGAPVLLAAGRPGGPLRPRHDRRAPGLHGVLRGRDRAGHPAGPGVVRVLRRQDLPHPGLHAGREVLDVPGRVRRDASAASAALTRPAVPGRPAQAASPSWTWTGRWPCREFARAYPSTVEIETIGLINGVAANQMLPRGELAKRVVGGRLPD